MLIKQNNNLLGIKIRETEIKFHDLQTIQQIILLEGSEQSVGTVMGILNLFAKMPGLKINKNKTRAIWIGT